MVNEEIVTALKNAVEHGENLHDAMQIMMNSGYSPAEVQEASQYVSGGTLHLQQPRPEENLTMPQHNSMISKMAFWKKNNVPSQKPMQGMQQTPVKQFQQQTNYPMEQESRPMQQLNPQMQQANYLMRQQARPMTQQVQPSQPIQKTQMQNMYPEQPKPTISVEQFPVQQIPEKKTPPLKKQLEKIRPPRKSHAKEIILLVILLILIGLLIATILYKDTILSWFS